MSSSIEQRRTGPSQNPEDVLKRRVLKKPTPKSRVNEEDEFSLERLLKAIFLTIVALALIIGFFYHVSVVIDKAYYAAYGSILEFVFIGVLGLIVNVSVSVKLVRFLNKVLFIKEDQEIQKKYL